MGKNIRQTVTLKAAPHEVYEILMDQKKHAKLVGSEASISRKSGGKFVIYGGDVEGKNLELVPDQKIVQTWRYNDWPAGHYSMITFQLAPTANGARLTFTQTDIPEDKYEDIKQGWIDYYWTPLKQLFAK